MKAGIPCAKVYPREDINDDSHFNACSWIVDLPVMDIVTSIRAQCTIANPFTYSEVPPTYRKAAVLGQHNHEALEALGYSAEEVAAIENEWEAKHKK